MNVQRKLKSFGILFFVLISSAAPSFAKSSHATQTVEVKDPGLDFVPQLGEIALADDGTRNLMNLKEAKTYCASRGFRLPTARELAYFSTLKGSVIKEIDAYPDEDAARADGFFLIAGTTPSGKADPFYFNDSKYKIPDAGRYGYNTYISSSAEPEPPLGLHGSPDVVYSESEYNGAVIRGSDTVSLGDAPEKPYLSVRCVVN